MKALTKFLAGGVGLAALASAAPAAAQYYPGYGYPGYGYGNGIGNVIAQVLGGNQYGYGYGNQYGYGYGGNEQAIVNQCVAAVQQRIDRRYGYSRYGSPYGYGAYGAYGYAQGGARVLGITRVERGRRHLNVRGTATANAYGGYNYGYGRQYGELGFRCEADYRGYITDIDVYRR